MPICVDQSSVYPRKFSHLVKFIWIHLVSIYKNVTKCENLRGSTLCQSTQNLILDHICMTLISVNSQKIWYLVKFLWAGTRSIHMWLNAKFSVDPTSVNPRKICYLAIFAWHQSISTYRKFDIWSNFNRLTLDLYTYGQMQNFAWI